MRLSRLRIDNSFWQRIVIIGALIFMVLDQIVKPYMRLIAVEKKYCEIQSSPNGSHAKKVAFWIKRLAKEGRVEGDLYGVKGEFESLEVWGQIVESLSSTVPIKMVQIKVKKKESGGYYEIYFEV